MCPELMQSTNRRNILSIALPGSQAFDLPKAGNAVGSQHAISGLGDMSETLPHSEENA
jgi:hypothetical protein